MEQDLPPGRGPAGADLVIPALALAFAGYFFVSIAELGWEAKSNGVIIGTILVALVAIQVARTGMQVARGRASLAFDVLLQPRDIFVKRVGLVAITVAFIFTLHWLGLTLGLFLGLLASLYLLEVRNPKILLGVSFVTSALVYILFIAVLDSAFPHGPVENLLAAVPH